MNPSKEVTGFLPSFAFCYSEHEQAKAWNDSGNMEPKARQDPVVESPGYICICNVCLTGETNLGPVPRIGPTLAFIWVS